MPNEALRVCRKAASVRDAPCPGSQSRAAAMPPARSRNCPPNCFTGAAEPAQGNSLHLFTCSSQFCPSCVVGHHQGTQHTAAPQEASALPGSEEMCPLASPTSRSLFSAFRLGRGNSRAGSMFYRRGLLFTDTTALFCKLPGQKRCPLSHDPSAAPKAMSAKAPQSPPHLPCAHCTPSAPGRRKTARPCAAIVGRRLMATPPLPPRAAETQPALVLLARWTAAMLTGL